MAFVTEAFPPRRLAAAGFVIALHGLLIVLLLRVTFIHQTQQERENERVYWLSLRAQPKRQLPKPPNVQAPARIITAVPRPISAPRLPSPAAPAAPGAETLQGLHLNFFNCALDNLGNLPPEERARCTIALKKHDNNAVDFAKHTNDSHNAARWARRLARQQNPLLLPCANPYAAGISLGTLMCVGKGIFNGFDIDALPGYGDAAPTPDHLPNNGDPGTDPSRR